MSSRHQVRSRLLPRYLVLEANNLTPLDLGLAVSRKRWQLSARWFVLLTGQRDTARGRGPPRVLPPRGDSRCFVHPKQRLLTASAELSSLGSVWWRSAADLARTRCALPFAEISQVDCCTEVLASHGGSCHDDGFCERMLLRAGPKTPRRVAAECAVRF